MSHGVKFEYWTRVQPKTKLLVLERRRTVVLYRSVFAKENLLTEMRVSGSVVFSFFISTIVGTFPRTSLLIETVLTLGIKHPDVWILRSMVSLRCPSLLRRYIDDTRQYFVGSTTIFWFMFIPYHKRRKERKDSYICRIEKVRLWLSRLGSSCTRTDEKRPI